MTELERIELKQLRRDFNDVFNTDAGKRVLKFLEDRSFVNTSTYTADNPALPKADDNHIHINEGARRVMLTIKGMMDLEIPEETKEEES